MESARSMAAGATNCSIELSTGGAVLAFSAVLAFRGCLLPASAPADSASPSETLSARLFMFSLAPPVDDRRTRLIAASITCRTVTDVERQQIEKVPAGNSAA